MHLRFASRPNQPALARLVPICRPAFSDTGMSEAMILGGVFWWRRVDSNHGPTDYEATIVALKLYMQSLARQNAAEGGRARNLGATRNRLNPAPNPVGAGSNSRVFQQRRDPIGSHLPRRSSRQAIASSSTRTAPLTATRGWMRIKALPRRQSSNGSIGPSVSRTL